MKKSLLFVFTLFFSLFIIGCHKHNYTEEIINPTCVTNGYTVYTCTCGDSYKDDEVDALGHTYGEWKVVKEATEEETGLKERKCNICNELETQTIPTLSHTHSYTSVVTKPTCTTKGYTTYTCTCGDSYKDNEVDALGHTYSDWKVVKEATETETGLKERKCNICNELETQTIPTLSHTHSYTSVVTKPTCTEQGYTTYTCTCGDSYTGEETNALGHSYGSWKVVKEATETETGLKEKDCIRCNDKVTEEISKLEHTHTYTTTITEPTCTEKGYTTYTCTCGDSYTGEETNALGHSYGSWKVVKEATETETGLKEKECSVCNDKITEEISKLEHTHTYTSIVTKPTCTKKGYTTYTCKCGDSYTGEETNALGHSYGSWKVVKEATTTQKGLKEKECVRCKDKKTEDIPMLSNELVNVDVTFDLNKGTWDYNTAFENKEVLKSVTLSDYLTYDTQAGARAALNTTAKAVYWKYIVLVETEYEDIYKISEIVYQNSNITTTSYSYVVMWHDGMLDTNAKSILEEIYNNASNYTGCFVNFNNLPSSSSSNKAFTMNIIDKGLFTNSISRIYNEIESLPIPTRLGYIFDGWKCSLDNKLYKSYPGYYLNPGEITYIAQWSRSNETFNIKYDLSGGLFDYGYQSTEKIGADFLSDFNKYSNTSATKENFLKDSTSSIKTALSNTTMFNNWKWLFEYMLVDLQNTNPSVTSAYYTDTIKCLKLYINGDLNIINGTQSDGANFRTLVRSYLHGIMNSSKGSSTNETFAAYCPDFSMTEVQVGLLGAQYDLTDSLKYDDSLPIPKKQYYNFIGWRTEKGELVTKVVGSGLYVAVWSEQTPVTSVTITNSISIMELYGTYQLNWKINPTDAVNKNVQITSSNTNVITVSSSGLLNAVGVGTSTITIKSLSGSAVSTKITITVNSPGYFDISYETDSYVQVGEEVKLNAIYVDNNGSKKNVTWSSLDESIASVDSNGYVYGIKDGTVTIRAIVNGDNSKYQDFVVTVLSSAKYNAVKFILDAHESNIFTSYNLGIGAGTPEYYKDIFGSVSDFLFNEELVIDYTYNKKTNDKYGSNLSSRVMESIEFITVHYTGNMNSGADGEANASYFALPLSSNSTSIHYSTGNDGIFKGLDEQYRAAHAGDDGSSSFVSKFGWIDTGLDVLSGDPLFPIVSITANATFAINGRDTGVKVPYESKYGRGYVTSSKWLNDQGIGVNIKDGKYQIGTSWWCYTQVSEGRICSNGGNKNSIGIESAVNKGSDLWYTWQKTAKLVADIMVRNNLDITKVKGHHFFSAKDCPQPMLENDLEIWWKFIEMVQAEYAKITTYKNYNISFSSESEYLNNLGRVIKQDEYSQVITYKVTVNDGKNIYEVELASILEGTYTK